MILKKNKEFVNQLIQRRAEDILTVYKTNAGLDWPELTSIADLKNLPNSIIDELKSIDFDYYINEYNHCIGLDEGKYTLPFTALENKNKINVDVDIEKINSQSKFLNFYKKNYQKAANWIFLQSELSGRKTIPIKKQTLFDKSQIIENFDECLLTYNKWAEINNFLVINENKIKDLTKKENEYWNRK